MPELSAENIIELLDLKPLPHEGGFYRETYRSDESLANDLLPDRFHGTHSLSTAIYYLLTPETFSAIHRIPSDEIFHFYLGDPVTMLRLHPNGASDVVTIGNDLASGHSPQTLVHHNVWQGAMLAEHGRYALLGTTVAPGFEFDDYEIGEREQLIQQYPSRAELITALTKRESL